jgi:hypothetical protein
MNDILTCVATGAEPASIAVSIDGYPVCEGGVWALQGNSAWWDLTLTTGDVAQLLGVTLFIFALVFSVKLVRSVILNER